MKQKCRAVLLCTPMKKLKVRIFLSKDSNENTLHELMELFIDKGDVVSGRDGLSSAPDVYLPISIEGCWVVIFANHS